MTDKLYSLREIAKIGGISYQNVRGRIYRYEIFPDEIKGNRYFYSQLKVQAIIAEIKYKRDNYKIYESKINYE